MSSATALLALYEQLSAVHDEMLVAVGALDWDRFVLLEQETVHLRERLQQQNGSATATYFSAKTDSSAAQKIRSIIQKILEQQPLIRDEVLAWRTDVKPMLERNQAGQTAKLG
ncbi:MAG: flagellar protein FliT [Pseudomonadota bacterium]